jgi:hypothetical protein
MSESCATCKNYVKEKLRPGYGECHRKGPKLFIVTNPQGIMNVGGWPPCQDSNWCGKY